MELAELRQRAMQDPESLSEAEWQQINKAAFSVPKKEFFDEDAIKVSPKQKKVEKGWGEE